MQDRANYTPKPVGWVYLDAGYTLRWRRGDPLAYLFEGDQMGHHGNGGSTDTIPVPSAGWTDLAEVRHLAERWLRHHRAQRRG